MSANKKTLNATASHIDKTVTDVLNENRLVAEKFVDQVNKLALLAQGYKPVFNDGQAKALTAILEKSAKSVGNACEQVYEAHMNLKLKSVQAKKAGVVEPEARTSRKPR